MLRLLLYIVHILLILIVFITGVVRLVVVILTAVTVCSIWSLFFLFSSKYLRERGLLSTIRRCGHWTVIIICSKVERFERTCTKFRMKRKVSSLCLQHTGQTLSVIYKEKENGKMKPMTLSKESRIVLGPKELPFATFFCWILSSRGTQKVSIVRMSYFRISSRNERQLGYVPYT